MSGRLGRLARWLPLTGAFAVVGLVVVYILSASQAQTAGPGRPPMGGAEEAPRADVSVVTVEPGTYRAEISGFGAAQPRYALELTSQVSGQVTALAPGFEAGATVAAGQVLATLEDSAYAATVAEAEYTLASARQTLLEEERERAQAQAEWKASGIRGQPKSELVLRGPQLATAQASVRQAEAALASARKDLERTTLTAPFDAVVVSRAIAPGSYIQAGGTVATLYSTDRVDVTLALPPGDWQSLPDARALATGSWAVTLFGVDGGGTWSGYVLRADRHVSDETRLRSLVVAVDAPLEQTPPLLPGTFVEARLDGQAVAGLWSLPGSALSQNGEIWYVADDGTLATFPAEPLFRRGDALFIRPPGELAATARRVVVHPLTSYTPGMAVNPVERGESGR